MQGRAADAESRERYPGFIAGAALAGAIGIVGGLIAVAFRRLIELLTFFLFTDGPDIFSILGPFAVVPIPAVGGLLVGFIIHFWLREIRGHGVPEVMYSLTTRGGRLNPKVIIGKPIAAAICIGSGGSVGRIGPIVHTGAAVGSAFGQWFKLPTPWIRILVAAGAATGISTTFNAPLSGVFFTIELLSISYTNYGLPFVVIASVTGSLIESLFFGTGAVLDPPGSLALIHYGEVFIYLLLGLGAALVGVLFIRSLHLFEDLFDGMRKIPDWFRPVLGGLIVGFIGLYSYDLFGVGNGRTPWESTMSVQNALMGNIPWKALFILIGLKIIATSSSIGSGGSGGVFAPILYLGAMTGLLFGYFAQFFFPEAQTAAYVTVGAAALFAGVARAPLTAIIFIVELTRTYTIIVPLMIAVFTSNEIVKLLSRETIYTEKLKRKGIDILRLNSSKLATGISVGDIMTEAPQTVREDESIASVREKFLLSRQHGFPVLDAAGKLYGIITLSDIEGESENSSSPEDREARGITEGSPISEICTTELVTAFPDETITEVLPRIFDYKLGQIIIIDPEDPERLVGLLLDRNLVNAWKLAYRHGEHSILSPYHMRERGE